MHVDPPKAEPGEESGYVAGPEAEGKRVYTITDAGRALHAERPDGDDDDEPTARHR